MLRAGLTPLGLLVMISSIASDGDAPWVPGPALAGRPEPAEKEFHGYDCLITSDPWTGFPSPPVLSPMLSERHADTVAVWAPAKVNLYLEVLAKRADGYHDIETLMVAVSLYDTLEFKEEASGEIRLRCGHPGLGTGPDNLVCRAA